VDAFAGDGAIVAADDAGSGRRALERPPSRADELELLRLLRRAHRARGGTPASRP